jgi:hypothetical protein
MQTKRTRTSAQARTRARESEQRLQPHAWRVVAGPPGCARVEITIESPESLKRLGIGT